MKILTLMALIFGVSAATSAAVILRIDNTCHMEFVHHDAHQTQGPDGITIYHSGYDSYERVCDNQK